MSQLIRDKLKLLPDMPGSYIMKNCDGKIIYVGKAVNLKNRVRSYFNSFHSHDPKTQELVSNIYDFEYIVTDTEIEALVLESILIQKHQPKYNIRIPDNKHFLYIKINKNLLYPRLESAYKVSKDKSTYFGPFPNSWAVRNLVDVLSKVFKLRTCKKVITTDKKDRACLKYHIKLCLGPCIKAINVEDYHARLEKAIRYLNGEEREIINELTSEMDNAAQNLQFEKAARIRDNIKSLSKVLEKQKIVSGKGENSDIISLARGVEDVCTIVMFMRDGHIVGRDINVIEGGVEKRSEDILTAFVKQYYVLDTFIPRNIIVDGEIYDQQLLEEWLTDKKKSKVYIHIPQRGDKKRLALMARKNAMLAVEERWKQRGSHDDIRQGTMSELAHFLKLPTTPKRIECYDISNTQGQQSVGSMVVFIDGQAAKKHYRRFRIKTVEGPDDFSSLKEVLERRLKKLNSNDLSFGQTPDLIIIDGGMGQLSSVMTIVQKLSATDITIVSLAKREELIYRPGSKIPIELPRQSRSLYLVQRIRDEAHRFAIEYHRNLRSKRQKSSTLLKIQGISTVRQRNLMKEFGSIKSISKASVKQLLEVKSMNKAAANAVYQYFNGSKKERGE
ncbi:excinuclease ABC subunit UvrC [Clostridium sp. 'deep sea']|uniref:excinuclease ABC subunit UvrC n=1 Tax=Clostridium sp. 'deep sea' TaxID=2779445 RepID=UPI0018968F61|nr:excinuclease ABC subunit UvrC [Clostridium sp. 'deep sea']QOR33808.1 excinuclease ABC subunit UvrC [Clostridium sp. 'deep sea']